MIATAREAGERIAALEAAGEALRERPVAEVVAGLATACRQWSDPTDPERREAVEALAVRHGVTAAAAARILDAAFPRWTASALVGWLEAELGHREAVDRFVPLGAARRRAFGPRLVVALAAHGVPTTPVADVLAMLLVKAPVWIKPATDGDDLSARFAATLDAVDAGLGAAVETAGWPASSEAAAAVLAAADTVVVTGRQETLTALRKAVGADARLLVHGPRLSVGLVLGEAADDPRTWAALADDTALAGQAGCLSPVVAYVEARPSVVERMVEPARRALEIRWPAPPRSAGTIAERAAFAEWAARADLETAAGTGGAWAGGAASGWSVQARPRPEPPAPPPVPRLLVLAPVDEAARAVELCARRRGAVATVGIAGPGVRIAQLAPALAAAGVERVVPLGAMQRPPIGWRRDGRATLAELVRWVDWEGKEREEPAAPSATGSRDKATTAPTRRAGP